MKIYSCDEIRDSLQKGAHLLDVRTKNEFSNGALPQAVNIPLHILPLVVDEHMRPEETVLVYCQKGGRASMAEKILRKLGYHNIQNIGGITKYQHCQ